MSTGQSSTPLVTLLADRGLAADPSRWQELFWGVADFARQRASQSSTAATWTPESLVLDANGSIQECSGNSNAHPSLPEECGSAWRHPAWARQLQTGRGDEFYSFTYLLCVLLAARRPATTPQPRSPWLSEADLSRPWKLAFVTDLRATSGEPPLDDPVLAGLPARLFALREQRAEEMPTMAESAFFFDLPTFSRLSAPVQVPVSPPAPALQPSRVHETVTNSTATPDDAPRPFSGSRETESHEGSPPATRESVPPTTAAPTSAAPTSAAPTTAAPTAESPTAVPPSIPLPVGDGAAARESSLADSRAADESEDIPRDTSPDALGLIAFGPAALTVEDRGWSWRGHIATPARAVPTATPASRASLAAKSENRPKPLVASELPNARELLHESGTTEESSSPPEVAAGEGIETEASADNSQVRDSPTVPQSTEAKSIVGGQPAVRTSLRDAPADQLSLNQLIVLGRDEEARARFRIDELREQYALGNISSAEWLLIRSWLRTHFGSLKSTGLRAAAPTLSPDGPPKYRVLWECPDPAIFGRCCVTLTRDLPGPASTPDAVDAVRSLVCSWNNGEGAGFILNDDVMDCQLAIWPCFDLGNEIAAWAFGEPLVLEQTVRELLPPQKPPPAPAPGMIQRWKRRLLG